MAETIEITFPDNSKKEFPKGITVLEVAKSISEGLAREAYAVKVDSTIVDLSRQLTTNASVQILTWKNKEGIEVFRHSSTHLMAQAVLELFPEAKPTIGPVVEEGFYYDIDHPPFTPQDIEKIEARMKEICARKLPCIRLTLSKKEALKMFGSNHYKVELISEMKNEELITAYKQGEFVDLCRGPHVQHTGQIKAVKILKIAGAYWRGDAKNKQLQRLYGISFPDAKMLSAHLQMLELAKQRDHRKLGREHELFLMHEYSPGSAFFLPKGTVIYLDLVNFLREEYRKRGYQEVITPNIFDKQLWETSGHWSHYKENMFLTQVEGKEFSLKPMNCPAHALIYKTVTRSYKELPLRLADFGALHRNELSGVIGGLFRVRKLCQDDSHIYCSPEQIEGEIIGIIDFFKLVYEKVFDFTYRVELSTRPEKFIGKKETWDKAEEMLESTLKKNKLVYSINKGDGAFYGPKIDFHVQDSLGRSWQLTTIQLDFNQAERFDLSYEGADGKKHPPVVIHRALFGSIERFIGILIEHYAAKFPLWLAPVQAIILPIADRHLEYANALTDKLRDAGIRTELDARVESVNKKVRDAQVAHIPLILTIGDKEVDSGTLALRTLDGQVKFGVLENEFIRQVTNLIRSKEKVITF